MNEQLPTLEMPSALGRAAQVRGERAADLAQAQEALRAAHIAVETAVLEDRAHYAESRDRGQDDPGPQAETAARDQVVQAERRLAGEQLRLARAEDELSAAVAENIDSWAERLGKLWEKADAASRAALEKFAAAERKRDEARAVAAWIADVQVSGDLDQRLRPLNDETALADARNSNSNLRAPQLIAALQQHVEETSAESFGEGAPERVAVRERDRRRAALLSSPQRAVRVAATLLDAGEFNLSEAEEVAAGESLEAVEERARIRRARERSAPVIIG